MRGANPSPGQLEEEEDEDDKATVLANPTHDYLQAALLPPTPSPTPERDPEQTPAVAPGQPAVTATSSGPPTSVIALGLFLAIVVIGGGLLWAFS